MGNKFIKFHFDPFSLYKILFNAIQYKTAAEVGGADNVSEKQQAVTFMRLA